MPIGRGNLHTYVICVHTYKKYFDTTCLRLSYFTNNKIETLPIIKQKKKKSVIHKRKGQVVSVYIVIECRKTGFDNERMKRGTEN